MCVLIVIGWIIAAVVWYYFGWVWGLIALVLFGLSGFGWVLVGGGIGGLWTVTSPKRRQFRKAWRQLECDATMGGAAFDDYFMEWASIYRPEGQRANDYLQTVLTERGKRLHETASRFLNDEAFVAEVFRGEVLRSLEEGGASEELLEKIRDSCLTESVTEGTGIDSDACTAAQSSTSEDFAALDDEEFERRFDDRFPVGFDLTALDDEEFDSFLDYMDESIRRSDGQGSDE